MITKEMNFDGLVGPTHNYAGLSRGNIASSTHKGRVSNPRAAALQGLAKMERLIGLGIPQGLLPPHDGCAAHQVEDDRPRRTHVRNGKAVDDRR